MNVVKLIIGIEAFHESEIACCISDNQESIGLKYFPVSGNIVFLDEHYLADIIRNYIFQFEKVIRSAIKGKLSIGQSIHCAFIKNFNFLKDSDYKSLIRMDRRNNDLVITSNEAAMQDIYRIYADGSFTVSTKQSGYGGFIEDPEGKREVYCQSFETGSSNLMELLAVTEGLERLKDIDRIQVNTDSRFVIRGLVQWVHFWKHNNWQTAYDSDVKFASNWQKADRLCNGKIIEFNWIKGHSGNIKQDFCHQLARKSAT